MSLSRCERKQEVLKKTILRINQDDIYDPQPSWGLTDKENPVCARAVFFCGFDYGENDWVYVDVWRFRDGPPNALRGWGAKQY